MNARPWRWRMTFGWLALAVGLHAEIALQEKVTPLSFAHQGPFVRAGDGAIWGMFTCAAIIDASSSPNRTCAVTDSTFLFEDCSN